jgi:hypothetical protein
LPKIVVEGEVEQRAIHIQQNGINLLPGDIKMHGESPAREMRDRVSHPAAQGITLDVPARG